MTKKQKDTLKETCPWDFYKYIKKKPALIFSNRDENDYNLQQLYA